MDNVQMNNEQQAVVTIAPKTANGNPTKIQSILWVPDDGSIVIFPEPFNPEALEHRATIQVVPGHFQTEPGVVGVEVLVDVDLGEGVSTLSDWFEVEISPAQAAYLEGEYSIGPVVEPQLDETNLLPPWVQPGAWNTDPPIQWQIDTNGSYGAMSVNSESQRSLYHLFETAVQPGVYRLDVSVGYINLPTVNQTLRFVFSNPADQSRRHLGRRA